MQYLTSPQCLLALFPQTVILVSLSWVYHCCLQDSWSDRTFLSHSRKQAGSANITIPVFKMCEWRSCAVASLSLLVMTEHKFLVWPGPLSLLLPICFALMWVCLAVVQGKFLFFFTVTENIPEASLVNSNELEEPLAGEGGAVVCGSEGRSYSLPYPG